MTSIRQRLLLGLGLAFAAVLAVAGVAVRDTGRVLADLRRTVDAVAEQRTRLALSSDATMRFVALAEADLLAPPAARGEGTGSAGGPAGAAEGRADRLAATADSLRRALLAGPALSTADRQHVEQIGARQGAVEVRLAVARAFRDVGRADDAAAEAAVAAATLDSLVADANAVAASQDRVAAVTRRAAVARVAGQRRLLAGGLLLAVLAALALAWATVRSITGPLHGLVAHARALSRGDFALRTDVTPLPGEFAALGSAMNHASAALDAAQAQLTYQAEHDPLTGLANRARFRERAVRALAEARAAGTPWRVAFLAVDLDGFKAVNDQHGHAAGDQVLIETAARLLNATRGSDTVARLGGDEFAVLLENVRHPADLALVAGRVVEVLGGPIPLDVGAATWAAVGASVGVALAAPDLPADGEPAYHELARRADVALYAAKARGKRQYALFGDAEPAADAPAAVPVPAVPGPASPGPAEPFVPARPSPARSEPALPAPAQAAA